MAAKPKACAKRSFVDSSNNPLFEIFKLREKVVSAFLHIENLNRILMFRSLSTQHGTVRVVSWGD